MTEPIRRIRSRKPVPRSKWGEKRGWIAAGAKFSPEEFAALEVLVGQTGTSKADVIHEATVLHMRRLGALPTA